MGSLRHTYIATNGLLDERVLGQIAVFAVLTPERRLEAHTESEPDQDNAVIDTGLLDVRGEVVDIRV